MFEAFLGRTDVQIANHVIRLLKRTDAGFTSDVAF
jgi:hypothetical protein